MYLYFVKKKSFAKYRKLNNLFGSISFCTPFHHFIIHCYISSHNKVTIGCVV